MYISRLIIKGYKSIKDLDLKFEKGKNVIIGKNNSGKSNILKAIDIVLGYKRPDYDKYENIEPEDFYNQNAKEIYIYCELQKEDKEQISISNPKIGFYKYKKPNF
jgi:putative ATP-dependent endonuclease of the OLD family